MAQAQGTSQEQGTLHRRTSFPAPYGMVKPTKVRPTVRAAAGQKRAQAPQDFFADLLRKIATLILVADSQGFIIYASPSIKTILGYNPQGVLGEGWWNVTREDPAERQRERAYVTRCARGELAISEAPYERQVKRRDGQIRWFLWEDAKGPGGLLIGVGHDITARKQAEESLRESEQRYRQMFEKNQAVKLLIDPDSGAIVDANPAAAQFYGYSVETLRRLKVTDINTLPPERVAAEMAQAALEQRSYFLFQHRLASGHICDVEAHSSPLQLQGRTLLYSIIHDISARRRAEQALHQSYNLLETRVQERTAALSQANAELKKEVEQRKKAEAELTRRTAELQQTVEELQRFARLASHDLQEPLRTVTSYVQLSAKRYQGNLGADADEFIGYAVEGAKRMQRLILDLLTYHEMGTWRQKCALVEGERLLARALTELREAITGQGAVITHDPLPEVWGDVTQLQLVFRHLIHNGIKFRRQDPPHVHISSEQNGNEWVFSVRDNGIGIHPWEVDRIFAVFERIQTVEKYPKPGVGLAICKKIIQRHGGRIWVTSEPGAGATFFFTLPLPTRSPQRAGLIAADSAERRKRKADAPSNQR